MIRRGVWTSEFYVALGVLVALLGSALTSALPADYAALGGAITAAAYAISRGIVKQGGSEAVTAAALILAALARQDESTEPSDS